MDSSAGARGVVLRPVFTAAILLVGGALSITLALFVLRTDAGMAHDDPVYLTRGLYHAAQVSERGNLLLPRLAWSLGFESPKPPLFHGLLAVSALLFGREHVGAVLVAGTLVPLALLAGALYALAREVVGPRAGLLAIVIYLAMPAALELGTRLLTETTLAATVIAGSFFAWRRARGGGIATEVGFGICAGLSLLTKLLGPLFLAPAGAVALLACWQTEGPRRATRFAGIAAAVALLVAGPWYLRNGAAVLAFASYARTHLPSLYVGPAWMRPVDFVRGTVGWALAALLLALLLRRPAAGDGAALLRRMALAAAAISAAVIGSQPMFDPRYWLPAAALLAAWAGVELDAAYESVGPSLRPLVAAALTVLVAAAAYSLLTEERPRTPWRASSVIARLGAVAAPPLLCELGNTPEWNIEKLRLAVELAPLRPRLAVADLLSDGRAVDMAARLDRCGVVFALPVEAITTAPNQRALNADLAAGWRELARHRELVADPTVARALGSRAAVQVFRRRPGAAAAASAAPAHTASST
jgi:4-amino-4-deoxy-L-arabinose transferase-like glycosyltransferase